jgi:hypothetical protein
LKENIKINQPAGAGAPFSFGEGLGMRASPPTPLPRRGGPLFDFHDYILAVF